MTFWPALFLVPLYLSTFVLAIASARVVMNKLFADSPSRNGNVWFSAVVAVISLLLTTWRGFGSYDIQTWSEFYFENMIPGAIFGAFVVPVSYVFEALALRVGTAVIGFVDRFSSSN
jgi:hypothetical protein